MEDTNASGEKMRIPPMDVVIFVAVAACSIIGLNLSLMLNTIGFYQVCKLAQIPTMCVLEGTFFGKKFSRKAGGPSIHLSLSPPPVSPRTAELSLCTTLQKKHARFV